MLAAARGYFGCLCSFPEVRKTVSSVSCTYLEVPSHLRFVTTSYPNWLYYYQQQMSHTGLIRGTQAELHGAQVLGLLRELAGGGENGATCVLHASSRARGCDLVLTWRSGRANFGLCRGVGVGRYTGAQAQG